jgi:hypothetical protein
MYAFSVRCRRRHRFPHPRLHLLYTLANAFMNMRAVGEVEHPSSSPSRRPLSAVRGQLPGQVLPVVGCESY